MHFCERDEKYELKNKTFILNKDNATLKCTVNM